MHFSDVDHFPHASWLLLPVLEIPSKMFFFKFFFPILINFCFAIEFSFSFILYVSVFQICTYFLAFYRLFLHRVTSFTVQTFLQVAVILLV